MEKKLIRQDSKMLYLRDFQDTYVSVQLILVPILSLRKNFLRFPALEHFLAEELRSSSVSSEELETS